MRLPLDVCLEVPKTTYLVCNISKGDGRVQWYYYLRQRGRFFISLCTTGRTDWQQLLQTLMTLPRLEHLELILSET